jgi:uncharacterized protein Yka (UPF0111/DUF47 family)
MFKELGMQNLADRIETGQQPRPNVEALSEKKNHFHEVFGEICEIIAQMKNHLKTMQRKTPENSRIVLLIERYENCEEEIDKICGRIRDF